MPWNFLRDDRCAGSKVSRLGRNKRPSQGARDMNSWRSATGMAVIIALAAGCMMAMVVEMYHAELLPSGYSIFSLSPKVHSQALAAACAGFLPAFLLLQRLNLRSWSMALRFTAPWLTIAVSAMLAACTTIRWIWALLIALSLGVIAYRTMMGIAKSQFHRHRGST
jgi:hypothetical protein